MSTPLLIPIENQVRELDPKLLLATCAAKLGIHSYVGYRTEMDIMITSFPRGIYLAKSFTRRSDKMFRILSKLGHTICAWDEEALVHYPPDIYYKRRLSPIALSYISFLFAWGQDNEDLFRSYPGLHKDIPIYKVGNPRLDILRKEFTYYFEKEISSIKNSHGKFILINTNFGNVNAQLPIHNLFLNKDKNGNYKDMGRGATGMGRSFSEGRAKYKEIIFERFLEMIPFLANKFPNQKFIIRPHPVEDKEVYIELATKYENIEVIQEGNVIPWIRASIALIHSGCTTGIEAYISNKPAISYAPIIDNRHGYCANFPNSLGHQCKSLLEIEKLVGLHISNKLPNLAEKKLEKFIEFDEETLCSTQMILVIQKFIEDIKQNKNTPNTQKLHGRLLATKRKYTKRIKSLSPKSKYHRSFQEVRFPTLSEIELQQKINKFAQIINSPSDIKIKQVSPHIFLVQ